MKATQTVVTYFTPTTIKNQNDNEPLPSHHGVVVDRTITHRQLSVETKKRDSLTRTPWGASQTVFETSTLLLFYRESDYCAPVWTVVTIISIWTYSRRHSNAAPTLQKHRIVILWKPITEQASATSRLKP